MAATALAAVVPIGTCVVPLLPVWEAGDPRIAD
jgi:hypothetical protein